MSTPSTRPLVVDAREYADTEARLRALVRTSRDVILLQGESIVALEAMARGIGAPGVARGERHHEPVRRGARTLARRGGGERREHRRRAPARRAPGRGARPRSSVAASTSSASCMPRRRPAWSAPSRRSPSRARRGRACTRRRRGLNRRGAARDRRVGPRPHGAERAEGARRTRRRVRRGDQRPRVAGARCQPGRSARLRVVAARLARALDPGRPPGDPADPPPPGDARARALPSSGSSTRAWTPRSVAINAPATRRARVCAPPGLRRGSPMTRARRRSRRSSPARRAWSPASCSPPHSAPCPRRRSSSPPVPLGRQALRVAHTGENARLAPGPRGAHGARVRARVAGHRSRRRRGRSQRRCPDGRPFPPERGARPRTPPRNRGLLS